MKELDKIPTTKVKRASKFLKTGAKIGGNYLKYYTKRALTGKNNKEALDEDNAEDIYASLSELKGSALKAAQMLSMDQGILPKAYADKFQMAQYSAPPLSRPLVERTFKKSLGMGTLEAFDTFSESAINAASIGQVHSATIGDKKYAVKIQYPGVADSVKSDLKMAMPLAARVMNVKTKDLTHYMEEVEQKMLEETDYELELQRSMELTDQCRHIEGMVFPEYYPDLSSDRVLTMDWIEGLHLKDWLDTQPSSKERKRIAQTIWDFYAYMFHELKVVHADPHPGNFIITPDQQVAVIDFGCVKEIPKPFYKSYFKMMEPGFVDNDEKLMKVFYKLEMLYPSDKKKEIDLFFPMFKDLVTLLSLPFQKSKFDFSDKSYFDTIFQKAEAYQFDKELRKHNTARGSKHTIYINRTYFGIYSIMFQLGAKVKTR